MFRCVHLQTVNDISDVARDEFDDEKPYVLMVDDYRNLASFYSGPLEERYNVVHVEDEKTAQKIYEDSDQLFDIIISQIDLSGSDDFRLEGIQGINLAQRLHSMNPDLPVVLMSRFNDRIEKMGYDWRNIGVYAILENRPDSDELLREKVDELVHSRPSKPYIQKANGYDAKPLFLEAFADCL